MSLSLEQKERAVAYAREKYCSSSDNDIEVDAEQDDADFSQGDEGTWVRGWLFVPQTKLGEPE